MRKDPIKDLDPFSPKQLENTLWIDGRRNGAALFCSSMVMSMSSIKMAALTMGLNRWVRAAYESRRLAEIDPSVPALMIRDSLEEFTRWLLKERARAMEMIQTPNERARLVAMGLTIPTEEEIEEMMEE